MRLKNIASHFDTNYNCNLDKFFNRDMDEIRRELLSLNGIGKETADSILLYAGNKCVFVVDAYTKRITKRLNFNCKFTYDDMQKFFQDELKKKHHDKEVLIDIFNEFHALIVIFSKEICKKNPVCGKCFLINYCKFGKNRLQ